MKKIVTVLISALFFCCSNGNTSNIPPAEQEMEVALAIIRLEMTERLVSTLPKAQAAQFLSNVSDGYLPRNWAYPEISHVMKNSESRLRVVLNDIEEMERDSIVMAPWFVEDRLNQLASDNLNEGVPNMMDEDWRDPDVVAGVLLSILWYRVPSVQRYSQPKLETQKSDTTIWSFRIADREVADKNADAPLPKPYFIVKVKNETQEWDVYLQARSGRIYLSPFLGKLAPDAKVEKTLMEAQIHAVAYSVSTMESQLSYASVFNEASRFLEFVNTQLQQQEVADSIVTRSSAIERVFGQYLYQVYKDNGGTFSTTLATFARYWGCSPKGYTLSRRTTTPDGDDAYYFKLAEQASPIDCSCRSNPYLGYYVLNDGSIKCYYENRN